MIDEQKLIEVLRDQYWAVCNSAIQRHTHNDAIYDVIEIVKKQPKVDVRGVNKWIIVTEQLPEVEEEVEVTYKWRGVSGEIYYNTARAFYSDSSIVCDESIFEWNDWEDCPFDEETGCYMTPKGWFEYNHFTDTFSELTGCEVIAWRPISPPYREE